MTVVVAAYLITVLGAFVAFYWSAKSISDEYVEQFALAQSLLERNRILSVVERELALSRKLADDPQIREWVLNEDDPELREKAALQFESYHRFLGYGTIFIAIRSSNNYYVSGVDAPDFTETVLSPEDPIDRWFFETLDRNQDYSLNVNYDALLDEVRVWMNVIVRDRDGAPIGVAGSGIDLTGFLDNLVDHKEPGISTVIVNSAGELQAHEDRSLIEHNARVSDDSDKITIFDLLTDRESDERLAGAIGANGEEPHLFPIKIGGKAAVAAVGNIPELDWHNLVLVDAGSIIDLADFLPLGLVFLLSLLLVLFCLLFLLNRLVLNPLGSLTRAAASVAEGAYDTRLPAAGDNEIGTLSASFGTMTKKIRDYTANLEAMVEERTEALATTNRELTGSQNRLMDSIHYGQLIQHSILPSHHELNEHLADYFALLEPVDLVGGDFYFFRETSDGFCLAAVDCTGHGIPGAFMTMMVNALLNRVIETYPDESPETMLEALHALVQETLRGGSTISHLENGLDIALCRVRRREGVLDFAGAGLPLFFMENGEIHEIPGDRRHLGFASSGKAAPLTGHRLGIRSGNRYYLITDGILDLPGGRHGFGLGRKGLRSLLGEQPHLPLKAQKENVRTALERHRGRFPQKDDMLIFGFSVDSKEDK